MLQQDQFELLSAYLDGEVTATERRQVEELLSSNEQAKHAYGRLLRLRGGFQGLPLMAAQPVDHTVEQVMARLDQRRLPRRSWLIGGGAIAAIAIGAVTGLLGPQPRSGFQFAWQEVTPEIETLATDATDLPARSLPASVAQSEETAASDALMIALDTPILDMGSGPKADGLSPLPSPEAGVN